jgi:isocitrate dehydrogenase
MAQKAEEYGSHDKTFEIATNGHVRVLDDRRQRTPRARRGEGDIWRMCQTKDLPIRDWCEARGDRAPGDGQPPIFWLDDTAPTTAS